MMTMNKTSLLFYLFLGEALAFVPQQQVAPTLRTNPCLSMPNAVDSSSQAATNEASQEFGVNPQQAHKNKTRLAWKLAKKDLDVARRYGLLSLSRAVFSSIFRHLLSHTRTHNSFVHHNDQN